MDNLSDNSYVGCISWEHHNTTIMTEQEKIKVAEKCGLAYSGKNAEGELQFIGTEQQWEKFDDELQLDSLEETDWNQIEGINRQQEDNT